MFKIKEFLTKLLNLKKKTLKNLLEFSALGIKNRFLKINILICVFDNKLNTSFQLLDFSTCIVITAFDKV